MALACRLGGLENYRAQIELETENLNIILYIITVSRSSLGYEVLSARSRFIMRERQISANNLATSQHSASMFEGELMHDYTCAKDRCYHNRNPGQ